MSFDEFSFFVILIDILIQSNCDNSLRIFTEIPTGAKSPAQCFSHLALRVTSRPVLKLIFTHRLFYIYLRKISRR